MKNTTKTRIDIVSSILEVIKNKKYRENNSEVEVTKNYVDPELESIYAYYFKENIEAVLGRSEFDIDEIELMATKEGLIIENIFTKPLTIQCLMTQVGPKIVGLIDGQEVFSIDQLSDTLLVNRVMNNNGVLTVYKANLNSNEFTFYQGNAEHFYTDEDELSHIAKLSNFNAKIKEFETFELTRIKPAVEKSSSLLQRIINNVTNDTYIKIPTSNELVNISLFADAIFDKIKEILAKDEEKRLKRK